MIVYCSIPHWSKLTLCQALSTISFVEGLHVCHMNLKLHVDCSPFIQDVINSLMSWTQWTLQPTPIHQGTCTVTFQGWSLYIPDSLKFTHYSQGYFCQTAPCIFLAFSNKNVQCIQPSAHPGQWGELCGSFFGVVVFAGGVEEHYLCSVLFQRI